MKLSLRRALNFEHPEGVGGTLLAVLLLMPFRNRFCAICVPKEVHFGGSAGTFEHLLLNVFRDPFWEDFGPDPPT